ncbi:MAG: Uma2 family endonuclease [Actinocatenispora sp.]
MSASVPEVFDVTAHDPAKVALGQLVVLHQGSWTEADYDALPEGVRVELHDGRLILTPDPTSEHQYAASELIFQLRAAIGNKRLVFGPVDVRMADGNRFRSPDVVVVRTPYRGRPADPANVRMVCEIVSPGGGDEYDQKMVVYAEAGIPWYLILRETPAGFIAELYALDEESGKYQQHSSAEPAGVLDLPAPFHGALVLRDLSL